MCPEIDETGKRAECDTGLCCGLSTQVDDPEMNFANCGATGIETY